MGLNVTLKRKYHVSYDGGKTLEEKEEAVYSDNITHNLVKMAKKLGIYDALWRPYLLKANGKEFKDYIEELEFEDSVEIRAYEIIPLLEKGLDDLNSKPGYFEKFNSPNGWGTYENFVPFVEKYLEACKEFPEAIIYVSR